MYRHPWRKVVQSEASTAWWDIPPVTKPHRRPWFLETECHHFMYRRGLAPPKRVRCEGCLPEDDGRP